MNKKGFCPESLTHNYNSTSIGQIVIYALPLIIHKLTKLHGSKYDKDQHHSWHRRLFEWSADRDTVSKLEHSTCCMSSQTMSHNSICPPRQMPPLGCTRHKPGAPTSQCLSPWRYHLWTSTSFNDTLKLIIFI